MLPSKPWLEAPFITWNCSKPVSTERKVPCLLLPVPLRSYTLLVRGSEYLSSIVDAFEILPPRIPFLSSVSGRYESDPQSIKRNLVHQLITLSHTFR